MTNIFEIKNIIIDAKKKYDKDKYIEVLEEQVEKMEQEIGRMNTKISLLEDKRFVLNTDHLELLKIFKDNNYSYYEKDIREYAKKSIELELALSELINEGFFEWPCVYVPGENVKMYVPDDKRIVFLQSLKNYSTQ